MAAIFAIGAVTASAQDPCANIEVLTAAADKVREDFANYGKATFDGKQKTIDGGKDFVVKYGACEPTKDLTDYINKYVPGMETQLAAAKEKKAKDDLVARFDNALKAKSWNEVYASGKEILAKYPDEFRDAVLVLGSIGLDETAKTPRVTTWNDDTLKYAKMSIADLEAGKTFKTFGVREFKYKSKEDALGWMNYTIGFILAFDKNNKKDAVPYLYKATQLASDTKNNPIVFQSIGSFYFDDVKRLVGEVTALEARQDPTATPEVQKALVEEIKAKVAMVNGTAEAAIDAYSRAYKLADPTPKGKVYKDGLYKTISDLYNVRFGKATGIDAWITSTTAKPMPNPMNPVAPIRDPEPVAPVTTTTSTTPTPTAKPTPTTTVKPAPSGTKPAGPAAKPASSGAKPQATVKKPVAKRKAA